MFGSAILEVAIGTVFVFFLFSIICSAIREGIEAHMNSRAAYLERGIRELLHDLPGKTLAKSVYEHPLIQGLYMNRYAPGSSNARLALLANGGSLPSYIPANLFANALMDIAARGPNPAIASDPDAPLLSAETLRASILNMDSEPVQRAILVAIDSAQGDLDLVRQNLQDWYDGAMDRVSGWYKRSTQWVIFWIGLVCAIALNINIFTIADYLYRNDAVRGVIVARAEVVAADSTFITGGDSLATQEVASLTMPIGWKDGWGAPRRASEPGAGGWWNNLFGPILGWLVTALAATMGAPFWFDVLNKVMVIRSTVKPREKSPEEGSEDRQPKTPQQTLVQIKSQPRGGDGEAAALHTPTTAPPAVESELVDACDVPIVSITADEDLPPAEGGVA